MIKESTKNQILFQLKLGVIQPFQIEEQLSRLGIPTFDVAPLAKEIREKFEKDHVCY